eukprot:Skav201465  [mRNA]  locus=scaffold663:32479:48055:+ [translate_table: standard]
MLCSNVGYTQVGRELRWRRQSTPAYVSRPARLAHRSYAVAPFSVFILQRYLNRSRGLSCQATRQVPPRPPKEEPTPFPSEPIFPPAAFRLLELSYEDPDSQEMLDALEDFQDLHEADRQSNKTFGLLIALHVIFILFAGQALHAFWPAGSEGQVLQPLYQRVKELPGTSSPLFFLAPFVATHVITCTVYLTLDWWRPAWVQSMMAHNRQAGDWGGENLGLARTLWSQLATAPTTMLIVAYMLFRNGPVPYTRPWVETCFDSCVWELPTNAPSLGELLVHLTFCLVVSDAAYGYVHLQLHRHRALWKHIHSIHHEYKETFVGPHVHTMEFLTVFIFAVFSPAACGAHPFTFWVWSSFYTLISLEAQGTRRRAETPPPRKTA